MKANQMRLCDASSGAWTPPHITKEQHAAYLRDVVGADKMDAYRRFRAEYQIGDA